MAGDEASTSGASISTCTNLSSMGVEACDDCGGQVGDSAETCPHCGSRANYLRRLQPLQEEAEKKRRAEQEEAEKKRRAERADAEQRKWADDKKKRLAAEAEKKKKTGCLIAVIAIVVLFLAAAVSSGGGGSSNDRSSPFDRCVDLQILHGSGGWAAAGECAHYKD